MAVDGGPTHTANDEKGAQGGGGVRLARGPQRCYNGRGPRDGRPVMYCQVLTGTNVQSLPESIVLYKILGSSRPLARCSCGSTNQSTEDLLAPDYKTSSRPLCSSKKLDAFKISIRKTRRVSDIKSLQAFHAQDLFGIGRT
ncbi:hypothetical protein B0H13DRAFT_1919726 [Mycena leptocephala]|nr:hypothetical protein B0H13DRAFT_1919726 [Mycena leptocephala]